MAQKKFTELPAAGALTGDEIFALVQAGASVHDTLNNVASFVTSAPFGNQSANVVLAGPAAGPAAAPTFRALVAADLPAGTIQDLQSVLDQGSIALATTAIELTSTEDILIRTYGSGKQVEIINSVGDRAFGVSDTNVWINSNGVIYPWPASAPASNGYVLASQTDGTLSWVAQAAGITIGTTTITSGTDTRVLYNNAGVVGEYAQVPVANGGTGAATLTGLLQGNGTSAFTAITDSSTVGQVLRVTGASTYAWGALDLADSDAVTGILPIANGGTGSSSAVWWALTGTSTLTGTTTIANGGNNLTFSGTGVFTVSSTNTSTSPINFTSTYTVPAGVAVSSYGTTVNGTITGKGTANDLISMLRVNGALNNSAAGAIGHVSLRVDTTHGGSTSPAISIAIQSIAGHSAALAEVFRGVSSAGVTRHQLFGDGRQVWTTSTTGSDFGGTMAASSANGAGHLLMSFQLSGSSTTAHTHFGLKATGGVTTNATNNTYYSFWDNRSLVVNNTGFTGYGFSYQPVITGTQAGTEVLYAFTSNAGLWGVGTLTPAVSLDVNGGFALRQTTKSQITSNQDNYAIGSQSSFRISTDASRNITGLTGGVDGKVVYAFNVGSQNVVFTHEDTNSTDVNRILSSTGGNITVPGNGVVGFVYDGTTQRWRDFTVR